MILQYTLFGMCTTIAAAIIFTIFYHDLKSYLHPWILLGMYSFLAALMFHYAEKRYGYLMESDTDV